MAYDEVLASVEQRLTGTFGEPDARASVTFVGADRIEVLRFPSATAEGEPLLRYATLGMSGQPMTDPAQALADPLRGPRAELLLTVRAGRADTGRVLRPLAVLAASPQVEGVVVAPDASLEVAEPLWPGAPFRAVLVAEPGGLVDDVVLPELPHSAPRVGGTPTEPVRFLPLLPMTPNEAAWKRVHGAAALRERWLAAGTDLRDPQRRGVDLGA
ncbi:suppressor of fused domain protein [Streptomyces synnematoformans]|uniref:Suppressor of fused domain protein n=1 Tax=Streptomyces synnematoformans TaxID=415721 RepID=A0ABN1ZST8_9ACTN